MTQPYEIIELIQGTREWLAWRRTGIGASDAPTIMGENPWKDPHQLLREKRGVPREGGQNEAMRRGTRLEPEARKCYENRVGFSVSPVCLQSTLHQWLRASLDGLSSGGSSVVEIKCGESVYRKTASSRRAPTYYYGQLQHILAVTGLGSIDFWCYLPRRSPVLVPVARDDNYIERLLDAEAQFWQQVTD